MKGACAQLAEIAPEAFLEKSNCDLGFVTSDQFDHLISWQFYDGGGLLLDSISDLHPEALVGGSTRIHLEIDLSGKTVYFIDDDLHIVGVKVLEEIQVIFLYFLLFNLGEGDEVLSRPVSQPG